MTVAKQQAGFCVIPRNVFMKLKGAAFSPEIKRDYDCDMDIEFCPQNEFMNVIFILTPNLP